VAIDDHLRIDTPEQVSLELPLAGVGSRFVAVAIDTLLQVLLFLGAAVAFVFVPSALGLAQLGPAAAIIVAFCVYWGYFALFEIFWSGRTPGKRAADIRVIKESGRPINAYEAIARNVVRVIDLLPGTYGVGVIVMLLNRQSRRLGDFVAGTVVVHEKQLADLRPTWTSGGRHASQAAFARVSTQELTLVETYLQRRFELAPDVREQRAAQIARRISKTTAIECPPEKSIDEFLEDVARQVRDSAGYR